MLLEHRPTLDATALMRGVRSAPGPLGEVLGHVRRDWYRLQDVDEEHTQTLFYSGRARDLVRRYLEERGMGVQGNKWATALGGLLRRLVGELAVVYRSPPARYLRRQGLRLEDDDSAQQILTEAYQRSRVDSVFRMADRYRALWRSAFVRLYPSDIHESVRCRIYPPSAMIRDVDPVAPEDLRSDRLVGIIRSDGRIEQFEPTPRGWRYRLLDGQQTLSEQILPELPIVALWDELPQHPYLTPFDWRSGYLYDASMMLAELPAAVMYDVHPRGSLEREYPPAGAPPLPTSADPEQRQMVVGPGKISVLEEGERLKIHPLQPQISAILSAVDGLVQRWWTDESLPTDAFRQSQSVSAVGIRALAAPLMERREDQLGLADEAEQAFFSAYRAMHNLYAESGQWDRPWLDDTAEIEVEIGEFDVPSDPTSAVDLIARELAIGIAGPVDAMRARHGIGRREAIERLGQVQRDREQYRIEMDPAAAMGGSRAATGADPRNVSSAAGAAMEDDA